MGSQLKMGFPREQNLARTQAKPLKPKPRQHQGHFDPEELSRRLYVVLADQKAHAERKKARVGEVAEPKAPRPWNARQPNKEIPSRKSKEASLEKATATHSSHDTSLKPTVSTSSAELRRQKSSKLGAAKKEVKASAARDEPKSAPAPTSTTYHHVPQEAAKQFQRTTTVETMRTDSSNNNLSHKLSKQALKLHLAAGAAAHSSALRSAVIEEQPISPVEKLLQDRERVDHWRSTIPEEPPLPEAEDEKEEYHVAPQYQQQREQYSFQAELARLKQPTHADHAHHRRNSTGDILAKSAEDNRLSMILVERTSLADVLEEGFAPVPEDEPYPAHADEHRVDWTQSDEQRAAAAAAAAAGTETGGALPAQRHKPLLSPLLKKADSIWTLRGRLGSGAKTQDKGDMPLIPEAPKSPKSPRSPPKGGFFAKFKR
jgi:hypothetical protein